MICCGTVISVYLLLWFESWTQQRKQAENDEHGRDHEGVRPEADEAQCRYSKADDGGDMSFLFQPLVEEDDDEHGRHDETDPGRIKLQQRPDQSAGRGADCPVEIVQQGDKEKKPAFIDALRNFCRIIDGKRLITHAEDEEKFFPAHPLIFFQHRQSIEQMARLNEQCHDKHLQWREWTEQHFDRDKFQRTAKDEHAHQRRIIKWKAGGVHINAVGQAEKGKSGQDRQGMRECRFQSLTSHKNLLENFEKWV